MGALAFPVRLFEGLGNSEFANLRIRMKSDLLIRELLDKPAAQDLAAITNGVHSLLEPWLPCELHKKLQSSTKSSSARSLQQKHNKTDIEVVRHLQDTRRGSTNPNLAAQCSKVWNQQD